MCKKNDQREIASQVSLVVVLSLPQARFVLTFAPYLLENVGEFHSLTPAFPGLLKM